MDVAIMTRERKGEVVNGDSFVDITADNYRVFSIIDGLGHGIEANKASQKAVEVISSNPTLEMYTLFNLLDKELKHTRGVAIAIMRMDVDRSNLQFAGVGNIDLHCTNKDIRPISYAGILGHNWRKTKVFEYDYSQGDLFAMFSDGISGRYDLGSFNGMDCNELANHIMENHGKDYDDATIMVVRI